MKVRKALELIRFNTDTLDDLNGRTASRIFNNKNIVFQLMLALDKYASETQAIESIYTISLEQDVQQIDMPPLALRSKTYRFLRVFLQSVKYPMDITNIPVAESNFIYQYSGVPRWLVPWGNVLNVYPTISSSPWSTNLTKAINATDTTIEVEDSGGLQLENYRVTIGDEKIQYGQNIDNVLTNCIRGVEDTVPASHALGAEMVENNLWFYYNKLNFRIEVYDDMFIDQATLDRELEIPEEHIQVITDYTSYKLLSKVDAERASQYKMDFDQWLVSARAQIKRGRKATPSGTIRGQFGWETNNPIWPGGPV